MNPTILCVDDDRHLCGIVAKALSGEGYEVHLAHDGDAALAQIVSAPPDLVLLDVILPKRDGFAVLESLRAGAEPTREIPVILISGCSQTPAYRCRAEKLGASEMLTKPVPLVLLLETVAKYVGGAACAEPAAGPNGKAESSDAAPLSGTLRELPLPALLHQLHGLRATGILYLTLGGRMKALQFRDGYAVAVKSNVVRECLGNYLVQTGRVSKGIVRESLKRMKQGEGLQGEILVAMKSLSEEELGQALRDQAREKLYELFEWTEGEFQFQLRARLERANALALRGSPADVVLEGVRRRFPIARVDAHLRASAEGFVAHGSSPFYRFQEMHLEPQEAELLRGLDGSRKLAEFLGADEAVRRLLYALLIIEMLALRDSPAPRAAQAAPAAGPTRQPAPAPPADDSDERARAELTDIAERMRGKGSLGILGVSPTASRDEIESAYAELSRRVHPDRFSSASDPVKQLAEDVFKQVADAYTSLTDDAQPGGSDGSSPPEAKQDQAEVEAGQRALKAELFFQRGETRLRNKDYLGALECFHQAVRLYPEEGEYHAYQGWAHYLARPEELEEAINLVREGAKLAPDREKPYLFLGRMVKSQGRIEVAEKLFTRVIQIRPDSVEALRELRLIDLRRKKSKGLFGRLLGK